MYCSAQEDVVEVQEMQQNLPWVSCLGQCNNAWMLGRLSVRVGCTGWSSSEVSLRSEHYFTPSPAEVCALVWSHHQTQGGWREEYIWAAAYLFQSVVILNAGWGDGERALNFSSVKGFRQNPCPSVKTSECGPIAKHCAYTAKPFEAWRRYRSSWTEVEHRSGQCLCATELRAHRSLYLFSL